MSGSPTQEVKIKELDIDMIRPRTCDLYDTVVGGSKTVVIGKPGTGKCLAPGTLVLMYNGMVKPVEKIQVGELLMGDDSTPREVLSTCSGMEDMYQIKQTAGDTYTVNESHILSLKDEQGQVVDINVKDYLNSDTKLSGYKTVLDFPENPVKVNGYTLGKYIFNQRTIIPFEELQLLHRITGNCSYIPAQYKMNCWKIRHDVLTGFLLSDYSNVEFKCPNLFQDVLFVIRSLGYDAIYTDTKFIHIYFNRNKVYDISITRLGMGKYYGFEIDGNKRFLLGDFTVTHNTTLIRSLLYSKKHIFPVGIVMDGNDDTQHAYKDIFPSLFIFNSLKEDKLEDVIKRQKLAKPHIKNSWAVVLLEDCTDDAKILNHHIFHKLYKNGRQLQKWFILSLHYSMDLKKSIRVNVDGVFILRETGIAMRESLYKNYGTNIPSQAIFNQLMDELTNDFCALYIHNASSSNNWWDNVYYYKAKPPPEFSIGCDEFWDFHFQRYNPNYVDPI